MRNNSIQNRQILAEQVSTYDPRLSTRSNAAELDELADDRMALVSGISMDPEAAIGVTKKLPPKWIEGIDEIQYEITRVRQKMKDLPVLHDKHMNRPTLDDSSEEEHAIEITTQEITQMFHRCQRAVTGLQSRCGHCTEQEERLLRNVVSSLAQSLQELSTNFRHTQSGYLKRMKNREERSKHFFDSGPLMEEDEELAVYDKGFTDDQLMLVEQNTVMVEEREREIRQIVQSISDLNEIFRDLAGMVVEQVPTSVYGEKLRGQVEERLTFYETGDVPRKNVDVMKEAIKEATDVATEVKRKLVKKEKKRMKREKKLQGANGDAHSDAEAENGDADTPVVKKKKRKSEVEVVVEEAAATDNGAEETETPSKKKKKRKSETVAAEPAEEIPETPVSKKKKRKATA